METPNDKETRSWPALAIGLYDRLTERKAEITYQFDDVQVLVQFLQVALMMFDLRAIGIYVSALVECPHESRFYMFGACAIVKFAPDTLLIAVLGRAPLVKPFQTTTLISGEIRSNTVFGAGLAVTAESFSRVATRTVLVTDSRPIAGCALIAAHRGAAAETEKHERYEQR